jgi:hypothetical protein
MTTTTDPREAFLAACAAHNAASQAYRTAAEAKRPRGLKALLAAEERAFAAVIAAERAYEASL